MKKTLSLFALASALGLTGASAADLYWNGADIAASPANGGTGTWNVTNSWRTGSDTGAQATWAAGAGVTDNAFLAGTAGTITLGTSGSGNFTGANLTVSTTGYTITSTSGSRDLVFSGTLSLANNVALVLNLNNTDPLWGFGTLSFASGSSLTIQGGATTNNSNRVSLSSAGTISGGSITLAGASTGPTGFVATASGVILNTNILNDSGTSATMLGATGANSLTYGGVLSGAAHLQISGGQAGGAGITTLSNINTFTGNTYLNQSTNGVLRIGVSNALPTGTTVFFGASAGGGTADTGGSIDLNGQNLTVGALDSVTSTRGIANNTGTLSTLTIGKVSGSNTFGGAIGSVTNTNLTTQTNEIAIVKTGASTQILSGTNTYTGSTTVNAGTLQAGSATSLGATTGAVTVAGGELNLGGFNITKGTLILSGGTLSNGSFTGTSYAFTNDGTASASATLDGSAGLTKSGAGTATLSAANAYSGGTLINSGVLALSGAGTLGSGDLALGGGTLDISAITGSTYTLTDTQTLSGAGSILTGTKTLSIEGMLNPGNSPGTINVTGDLALTGSTISNFEINGITSGLFDQVNVTGTLTLGGTLNLMTGYTVNLGETVQLFTAGTFAGAFDVITGTDLGGGFYWDTSALDTMGIISVSAIPEPNTVALFAIGIAFALWRSRRLKRVA